MQYSPPTPLVRIQSDKFPGTGLGETSPSRRSPRRNTTVSPTRLPSIPSISSEEAGTQAITKVLLPRAKLPYIPNLRPPPELLPHSTIDQQQQDPRWRKTILSRFLLEDATISFSLGTKFAGTVIRDKDEIPLDRILDYVTPYELERFETAEFIKEDAEEEEAERLRTVRRPKGRPVGWRADMGVTYQQFAAMKDGAAPSLEKVVKKRPTGPAKYPKREVPSFNGPQPLEKSSSSEDESSGRERAFPTHLPAKRGPGRPRVYSLVAAAGIGPQHSGEDETSRDITPAPSVSGPRVRAGGPPKKLKRFTSIPDRTVSPELELSSQMFSPAHASQAQTAPQVVIPGRINEVKGGGERTVVQVPSIRRRCRKCIKQKQSCNRERPCQRCDKPGMKPEDCVSGDEKKPENRELHVRRRCYQCAKDKQQCNGKKPCERCRKSGRAAEDCRSEDEVKSLVDQSADVTDDRASTRATSAEEILALIKQFQPAGTLRRSSSSSNASSSDSLVSGPSITVEAHEPTIPLQAPSPIQIRSTGLSQNAPAATEHSSACSMECLVHTSQRAILRPKSLTPYYPISSLRGRPHDSPKMLTKNPTAQIIYSNDDNPGNDSSSKKRKRSREPGPLASVPSSSIGHAQDATPSILSPFRTIQQYYTARPTIDGLKTPKIGVDKSGQKAIGLQQAVSKHSASHGHPAVVSHPPAGRNGKLGPLLVPRPPAEHTTGSYHGLQPPVTTSHQYPTAQYILPNRILQSEQDKDVPASSSSAAPSIHRHQPISVGAPLRPSDTTLARTQPPLNNPTTLSRRPSSLAPRNIDPTDGDRKSGNRQNPVAPQHFLQKAVPRPMRVASTNASQLIRQQGELTQQWKNAAEMGQRCGAESDDDGNDGGGDDDEEEGDG